MRFRALDGFRGFCALLVALYHFPVYSHIMVPQYFLPNAQMLLDFFFVMSGFVIAGAYGDVLKSWLDLKDFAIRRFARLWPLHAAVLVGFVLIEVAKLVIAPHAGFNPPFTGRNPPNGIVTSLLLIHSLDIHKMLVWNAPSWTVSVEFWTYLIYGALVVAWPRRPLASAVLMALAGVAGIAFIAGQLAANFDFGLFRCFYGFFCGVVIWRVWRAAPPRLAAAPPWVATCLEAAVTVGAFAYIALLGGWPAGLAGPIVFALFIAVYASERGAITRLWRWPPLVRLGEISYSIYLVHYLVVVMIGLALKSFERLAHVDLTTYGVQGLDDFDLLRFRSEWFMDGVSIAFLALVVAISTQTNRWIEEPGRKFFSRLAPQRRRGAPRDAASLQPRGSIRAASDAASA